MQVRARLDERGQVRGAFHDLFEVVEDEEQLALADVAGEIALRAERLRDCRQDSARVVDGREADPEDAVLEFADELGPGFDRETGLP